MYFISSTNHTTSKYSSNTCQQTVGCFLAKIYCVSGDGSNSYLSKGKFSITNGSELVQVNFTFGCAVLGGNTELVNSGQKDSGIGQNPAKIFSILESSPKQKGSINLTQWVSFLRTSRNVDHFPAVIPGSIRIGEILRFIFV